MNDHMINERRFFRNRFERYAVDRFSVRAEDLDGSPLTLRQLCNILVNDQEEVPPFLKLMIARRFARSWVDSLPAPLTYGALAKMVRDQPNHHHDDMRLR